MKYCVEISKAYVVEASNDDEAVSIVLSADIEKLNEYHKVAEYWEEVTAVYDEEIMAAITRPV